MYAASEHCSTDENACFGLNLVRVTTTFTLLYHITCTHDGRAPLPCCCCVHNAPVCVSSYLEWFQVCSLHRSQHFCRVTTVEMASRGADWARVPASSKNTFSSVFHSFCVRLCTSSWVFIKSSSETRVIEHSRTNGHPSSGSKHHDT